tara:strand:+ start:660 stop:818 length:159 start_codon:yes stop_codon:yes gene_type:complete
VLNKEETEKLELFSSEIAFRLTLPEPGGAYTPPYYFELNNCRAQKDMMIKPS